MLCIICKKYKSPLFQFNRKNYCTNHSKLNFNNLIIKIQKIYRGYRRRSYLKTVYNRLPRDLQLYVLNINSNNNNKEHEHNINAYIIKKTHKIRSLITIEDNEITLQELTSMLTLLNKYYYFLTPQWLNYYKFYFTSIKNILVSLLYRKAIMLNISIYNSLNFYTNLLNNNFTKESLIIISKINTFSYLIKLHNNVFTYS